MPGIAEQVATIEHDLQEALAKNESLAAEKEALAKALTAMTSEKSELEAKRDDMQTLVDETRDLADKLANMALGMLRASRRQIFASQSKVRNGTSEGGATSEFTEGTEAAAHSGPDFTGQCAGLKRFSNSETTAASRLRAQLLLDTAAGALERRSPRVKLPDGMPVFLQQTKGPPTGARRVEIRD
jgi:seryl-tRNA synthetase